MSLARRALRARRNATIQYNDIPHDSHASVSHILLWFWLTLLHHVLANAVPAVSEQSTRTTPRGGTVIMHTTPACLSGRPVWCGATVVLWPSAGLGEGCVSPSPTGVPAAARRPRSSVCTRVRFPVPATVPSPRVCHGRPCITVTEFAVHAVISRFGNSVNTDNFVRFAPHDNVTSITTFTWK